MFLPFSVCLLLLSSFSAPSQASSKSPRPLKRLTHPAAHLVDIFPRVSTINGKRDLDSGSGPLRYDDSFRLILSAFDDTFHLHLSPNNHLIHPAARITYYDRHPDSGETITNSVPLLRESVRVYQGYVIPPEHTEGRRLEDIAGVREGWSSYPELGWARITVFKHEEGAPIIYEGAFSVNGVIHHVTTKENYNRVKRPTDPEVQSLDDLLVIWRDSDIMSEEEHFQLAGQPLPFSRPEPICGHDRLQYNVDPRLNEALRQPHDPSLWPHLWSRGDIAGDGMSGNFVDHIGQTTGCPTSQKIVYMGVAADCVYVSKQGSAESATNKILSDWNSASSLYKSSFNISLGIVELSVQQPTCPAQGSSDIPWNVNCDTSIEQRLSLFSSWRGNKGDDGTGLWHLMSGCPTGQEVGIAWMATLCRSTASSNDGQTVSGTGVSTIGLTEWQVVAHEVGHNFGAIHDCTDGCTQGDQSCCPLSRDTCNTQSQYVMSPVSKEGEFTFSPCSIGNICSLMSSKQTDDSCLSDPSSSHRPLISLKMCGNGIVEDGEDCDPGSNKTSPCCDSTTCKFINNAKCDPQSSSCCTDKCEFASKDTVCRPSKDSRCDVEEKCTGTNGNCPSDVVKSNGESCGDNGLKCASGVCTSVALQCQTVGASLGLREACRQSQDTCELTCQNPNSSNSCVRLSSLMIDGSPCGLAGTCENGQCKTGNWLDAAKQWYRENLQIAIPVTIAAALIIIGLIYCCFTGIFRRRRTRKTFRTVVIPPAVAPAYHQRLSSRASQFGGMAPMRETGPIGSPPPGQTGRRLSRRV